MNYKHSISKLATAISHSNQELDYCDLIGRIEPYKAFQNRSKITALQSCFPLVKTIVGDKNFSALCKYYAKHYPSKCWNLHLYGASFPKIIAAQISNHEKTEFQWRKVSEIAQIEYLLAKASYSFNDETSPRFQVQCTCFSVKNLCQFKQCHTNVGFVFNIEKEEVGENIKETLGLDALKPWFSDENVSKIRFKSASVYRQDTQIMVEFTLNLNHEDQQPLVQDLA